MRKSDQVSRCSSKSSLKHSSKSSAKSSSSSKSRISTKAKTIEDKVKVAELMMKASFIKKRRDIEYQTRFLILEEELAKARARAEIYENESKIGQSRKTKSSTPNDVHTNQGISATEDLLLGVMLMKKGSVIFSMRREYISIKTIANAKTT